MSPAPLRIVMLASENDAIPGAKVGGIGDVVRDVPRALGQLGHTVHVVIPAYGKFHLGSGVQFHTDITTRFRQKKETVQFYEKTGHNEPNVRYWLAEHALFSLGGAGQIYCDDPDWAPFESDATKFALFCQAAAAAIDQDLFGQLDVVHLHDWHAAFYAVLREFDPQYLAQQHLRCVFSLHNLALQGIRPLEGSDSSLNAWYPWLPYDAHTVSDPRWSNCINPVASAIRLCDRTHTVSPSYAREIQQPNAIETRGFHGGEGLESLLQSAAANNRLTGILNGCDYSGPLAKKADWPDLVAALVAANQQWLTQNPTLRTSDYLVDRSLAAWSGTKAPHHIVTSIGRLTEQKVSLLMEPVHGSTALESMLSSLGQQGVMILLGTGDSRYEQFFLQVASRHSNFLFLNHFSQAVADLLYASGSLFVMPSSYEPCGISQMLAMKHGQPCLVHAVGGLIDTVDDQVTGFHFSGGSLPDQAAQLVAAFERTLALAQTNGTQWQSIQSAALARRFEWRAAAEQYEQLLYR